jgi:predicted nucleotidyltransferase
MDRGQQTASRFLKYPLNLNNALFWPYIPTMLKPVDSKKIRQLAEKYSAKRILLFGSAAAGGDFRDIDLAVEGVRPEQFFKFYSELLWSLSKPVDLVDLSEKSLFSRLIESEGTLLYAAN